MPIAISQNTITAVQARKQFGQLLDKAYYRRESFVVARAGEPRAVIVPLPEYADMQRRKQEAKERFFAMTDELRTRFAKEDPKKVQQAIDEAIRAVRLENKRANATK